MFIEVKENPNWSISLFGKKILVNKKYYGMILHSDDIKETVPQDINIVPMDENYVNRCDGMNYMVKHFWSNEKNRGFRGGCLLCNGEIAGYICGSEMFPVFWRIEEDLSASFYIKYVFVNPQYRGNHYAHYLVDYIVRTGSCDKYCLMVRKNNSNAINSYEHIGFKKCFLNEFLFLPPIKKNFVYCYKELM